MVNGLMRYDPVRSLSTLQEEFDRLMRGWVGREMESAVTAGAWSPTLDVEETDDAYMVHVELPGIAPEDIDVNLENNVLSVSGERRFYQEREAEGFRRVERRFGRFHRALRLPDRVDPDQVEATYDNGLLTVKVVKSEQARPRRIEVRPGGAAGAISTGESAADATTGASAAGDTTAGGGQTTAGGTAEPSAPAGPGQPAQQQ